MSKIEVVLLVLDCGISIADFHLIREVDSIESAVVDLANDWELSQVLDLLTKWQPRSSDRVELNISCLIAYIFLDVRLELLQSHP